ncbi:hypothetical protein [Colwellia sp. RSH04]|uniref:hypothetical protein n=1 Tax=Colwellia sp. RSH04 TaxID=2305464 RepID=UPI000E56B29C|nr:hypothetical protein [Colwellia sp. RSH04]RHW76094.1 hypothetical protein D1094_10550 [Colwellia sp. RSH04]
MIENILQQTFNTYIDALKNYQLKAFAKHYFIPCTLNTPDNLVFIKCEQSREQALSDIFLQLKTENTAKIITKNLGYQIISDSVIMVSVDWYFFDENQQCFAEFTAIYHLLLIDGNYKIFNVISHDISNSIKLANRFTL